MGKLMKCLSCEKIGPDTIGSFFNKLIPDDKYNLCICDVCVIGAALASISILLPYQNAGEKVIKEAISNAGATILQNAHKMMKEQEPIKVTNRKKVRIKCADCGDHGHGCPGAGRSDGLGHEHCRE